MPQQFTNNARALLASGIAAGDTVLTVEAPKADLFPTASTGTGAVPAITDWFKATLENVSGQCEIIYVRTRTSGSAVFSNVLRGQEGTTARAYSAGDVVGLRLTSLDIQNVINLVAANNTFTGNNVFSGSSTFNGGGTFTPQVTMAGGVKIGTNWTVTESGTSLIFAEGGVNKMKIDAAGNLTVAGDITAFGAV